MKIVKYRVVDDLVYKINGVEELLTNKRFDGSNIFEPTGVATYYIDSVGVKHIAPHDPSWQALECDFSAP